ncbi:biopolymer transporter ExbD [bacterium]|nr:biopolymer transporter ExbD [bacterium]
MKFIIPGDDEELKFDLTPLVDVIFLLLIFFMVTTTFVYQPTIKINLPSSKQPVSVNRNYISITVDKNGNIFLFEKKLKSVKELVAFLRREYEDNNDRIVLIRGDKDTRYENVITLLDTVKNTGFKRVLIATKNR